MKQNLPIEVVVTVTLEKIDAKTGEVVETKTIEQKIQETENADD